MKQIHSLSLIIIICLGFNACNENGNKKTEEVTSDSSKTETITAKTENEICPGNWNITVPKKDAEKMIFHYRDLYGKTNFNLTDSVWIDELIVRSLGAFFESPGGKDFDGARFFNGASSASNESMLILVPTKGITNTDVHQNIWGNGVFSLLEGTPVKFQFFNKKYNEFGKGRIDNFDALYRKKGSLDSLSIGVWMNRCVFIELRRLIEVSKQTSDPITGVSILFGAYDKFIPEIKGQKYANQSTIILVPTSSDGAQGHTNRWDIIEDKKIKRLDDAGYNHGALCPQICN